MSRPTTTATLPNVLDRAMALTVDRSRFGTHRKVRNAEATVVPTAGLAEDADAAPADDAEQRALDQRMLSVQKKLITAPELKAVEQLDRAEQDWLLSKCVPSYFRPGIYLVPFARVEATEARMLGYQARRGVLVDAFLRVYAQRVLEMRATLGALWRASDYPDEAAVRATFGLSWRWLDLGAPTRLRTIDQRLFAAERERVRAEVDGMARQIRETMRVALLDLVTHMTERLSGVGQGGRPKVFRDTLVSRLTEFLDDFDGRNLTDDADLAGLVAQARQLMSGVTPAALRDDGAVRDRVAAGMEALGATLGGMVTTASGARAITFTDND